MTDARDGPGNEAALRIEAVEAGPAHSPILRDLHLRAHGGQIVGIFGESGSGRTALLEVVAGLRPIRSGTVAWDRVDLGPLSRRRRSELGIAFVPAEGGNFPSLRVSENLALGLPRGAGRRRCREALERCYSSSPELAARRHVRARDLSGGERRMLAVARALLAEPRLLLLDEAARGLTLPATERLLRDLRSASQRFGTLVLWADATEGIAAVHCDACHEVVDGRLHRAPSGSPLSSAARSR